MSQKKLRVAVIGPNGMCGKAAVDELLLRGHRVVGISRTPNQKWEKPGDYSSVSANVRDVEKMTEIFSSGFDAIVISYGPSFGVTKNMYQEICESHGKLKQALLQSTHKGPYIVIGGAMSLHNKDGKEMYEEENAPYNRLYNSPDNHFKYYIKFYWPKHKPIMGTAMAWFMWAKNNVEKPNFFSWLFRPLSWGILSTFRRKIGDPDMHGAFMGDRLVLRMWEGVSSKKWSFLSPPWQLRGGGVRTGKIKTYVDSKETPAWRALDEEGIYVEDLGFAIADECEKEEFCFKHWTATGPLDLKEW